MVTAAPIYIPTNTANLKTIPNIPAKEYGERLTKLGFSQIMLSETLGISRARIRLLLNGDPQAFKITGLSYGYMTIILLLLEAGLLTGEGDFSIDNLKLKLCVNPNA